MLDLEDFLGCGWSGGLWEKSGGDELAAEGGEHVEGGGFGFGAVPGCGGSAVCGVGGGVAVQGVPEDQQGVAEQPEHDGAFDGFLGAVAGLADAEDVLDVEEQGVDGPSGGVAGDDLLRGGGEVGGDQRDVVAAGRGGGASGVVEQDDADGVGAPGAPTTGGRVR